MENCKYLIVDVNDKTSKNGNSYKEIKFKNPDNNSYLTGRMMPKYYSVLSLNTFKISNIVKIIIQNDTYDKERNSCLLESIEVIQEAKAGLELDDREKLFNQISELVESFNDETLKAAVKSKILENTDLFKISPAAKSMHHNYVGGLMQHIWECVEFALILFPKFRQNVNHETILAACVMHDIGKMFEYKIDVETGIIEVNDEFKKDWISHTQYGYSWAMNNDFKQLAKMIAAHHGRSDWEAIIDLNQKNLDPELYLMHHIDDLSAKFGTTNVHLIDKNKISING